jgi:hypothetical protein
MHAILCTVPTLALSVIYCVYQTYRDELRRRHRVLRERVTYMLWVMAQEGAQKGVESH